MWVLASVAGIVLLATALHQNFDQREEEKEEKEEKAVQSLKGTLHLQEPIRVEVLNGCGVPQVAARLTKKSRTLGLDVIHEGNAVSFNFLHTMVIDRSGDPGKARQVASILGIPHCIQQITEDAYRLADVSIIIGRDYLQMDLLADAK